jgi:7,8-dihydropterin-6-yl-methyl-4-(beta-D-ribofuranosyl)aminobenzene 5'-phosphate synthase
VDTVHAVLGGFHLTGPVFDPIIEPTIAAMKEIGPDYVVPMHCTGWKAINQFAKAMPGQFVLNSVGTTYVFQ